MLLGPDQARSGPNARPAQAGLQARSGPGSRPASEARLIDPLKTGLVGLVGLDGLRGDGLGSGERMLEFFGPPPRPASETRSWLGWLGWSVWLACEVVLAVVKGCWSSSDRLRGLPLRPASKACLRDPLKTGLVGLVGLVGLRGGGLGSGEGMLEFFEASL